MKTYKHITRFTYEFTSFQGWRLTICRQQRHYTRYFSDKQYGGEEAALQAALHTRDLLMASLAEFPANPECAFEKCRAEEPLSRYPRGLRPRKNHPAG